MAHARRKFHHLLVSNPSQIAVNALELFGALYGIERDVVELPADERVRDGRSGPSQSQKHCIRG